MAGVVEAAGAGGASRRDASDCCRSARVQLRAIDFEKVVEMVIRSSKEAIAKLKQSAGATLYMGSCDWVWKKVAGRREGNLQVVMGVLMFT